MLKIGLFGAGHLGKFHLQQWQEVEGARLAGFYDPLNDVAEAVAAEHGIPRFDSAEALLDAVDAVDIVTPTPSHHPLAMQAGKAGKHLFIEKPLAQTLDEAREIVSLVESSGITCAVGHVERYNPALLALGDTALAPLFIEGHRLAQFNPRGTDVSVILDLMIHDLDVILHLVKSPVRSVSASGVGVVSETADIANARIEFENGCVANLTASRISLKKMRKMRLFRRDAYLSIDFLEKKVEVVRLDAEESEGGMHFPIETAGGEERIISVQNPEVPATNALRAELADFVQAINSGRPPRVTAHDGLRALELAHHILDQLDAQRAAAAPTKK